MSLLSIAVLPIQDLIPATEALAGTAASAARPLLGLGALAAFVMVFKPLLLGLLRAALLLVKPRRSMAERIAQDRLAGVLTMQRMARDIEASEPNLAAELRSIAGRY